MPCLLDLIHVDQSDDLGVRPTALDHLADFIDQYLVALFLSHRILLDRHFFQVRDLTLLILLVFQSALVRHVESTGLLLEAT